MGTIAVTLILASVVCAIIARMLADKKSGISGLCGGDCSACHGKCGSPIHKSGASKSVKTVVMIDGMICGMCESHINDIIRQTFSVQAVSSSHKTGRCEIVSRESLPECSLRKAIESAGYNVVSITVL